MRQFLFLLCFFSCASVLADHDGSDGYNYNGRTFKCNNYEKAKDLAENAKDLVKTKEEEGRLHYNFALCQIHRGPEQLMAGIVSLQTAVAKRFHGAAITLAEYHSSDGYDLPLGKVTNNESNLKKAIEYRELAVDLIHNQPNYPFSDIYKDDLIAERRSHHYLNTAGNIPKNYLDLFIEKIKFHRNSKNTDIKNATIEALENTIKAADNCLAIEYIENVWSSSVYDKSMARCEASKQIAETLLDLEKDRLSIASTSCQKIKLSECKEHQAIESEMLRHYKAYKVRADQLVQQLAAL